MEQLAVLRLRLDSGNVPAASTQAAQAIGKIGEAGQISARQTAFAMRQLPAQFTDIVTQLQGGASPLTVLIQQGGQIKDSFGGIRPALAGLASFISPVSVAIGGLAAGVGVFAYAAAQGAKESAALRDALALTGNAAGLTGARFQATAEAVAQGSQQGIGKAKEIVLELARSGQVSAGAIGDVGAAVARVADVTGEDAKKVAADFATMGNGVAKWAAEHNKAWNFISVEQYKYIRRLEEQGKAEEAEAFVSQKVTEHLADQQRNLGYLQTAWDGVGKAASAAWDFMLGIGRQTTTRQELDIAMARLAALGDNLTPKARAAAEQRIQFLKEQLKLENQQADAASRNAAANRLGIAQEIKNEGKTPEIPNAFTNAQQQYKADFLRSEKEYYKTLGEEERKAFLEGLKDPLGEFIVEKVLPADKERQERQLQQYADYLQRLQDANEEAAAQMLGSDTARNAALLKLDRDRQLRALQLAPASVQNAARETLDERASLAARSEVGTAVYQDTKGAIAAALQDSRNPARAFAQTLADAVRSRLANRLAESLTDFLVGANGLGGGGFGNFLRGVLGFGGFFADGGLIRAGQWGIVGERGPEIVRGPASVTPMKAAGIDASIGVVNVGQGVSSGQVYAAIRRAQAEQANELRRAQMLGQV